MSTEESTSVSQTPMQEALDRAAESFPAFLMPRLVGVDHLMRTLSSARRRVDDSHKLQMAKLKETLGYEPNNEGTAPEEEDMGGISVAGDTHITIAAPPEKTTALPAVTDKAKSLLPKFLVAASLLGGGSGIGYIIADLMKSQPAPTADTDTDSVTEIDVKE